ncbi:MAG: CDP-alcohol phosphatidyltransferase family protein [Planctomycetes bacterium]|nr:CDP-alcohol phosphatidyltransferase family protein [Planctomycetota bacterium]
MNDDATVDKPKQAVFTLANSFTFARFLLAPVVAWLILRGDETDWVGAWIGGWLAGLAMFTDVVDGYVARRSKQVSDIGKLMDPLADATFFLIVWTAYAYSGAFIIWLVIPFFLREGIQHLYIRRTARKFGVALAANFWGKMKTLFQTLVLIIMAWFEFFLRTDFGSDIGHWSRPANNIMIAVVGVISLLSIIPYFRELKKIKEGSTTNDEGSSDRC